MPATPIMNPAAGESLVGTEPQLLQQVDPGWRHRLNLFTGRALSDTALDGEQAYRAGLLTTMGQSVTAGTVTGLALTMDAAAADPVISVSPGYGISASGEDVVLHTPLKTNLSTLPVLDPVSGNQQLTFRQFVLDPTNTTYAGVLVLQPVIGQVSGQITDTGNVIVVSGNLGASCNQDPAEYAFEDWQIVDAARLVFVPWPNGAPNLALPPVAPQESYRNRLAYTIFNAEAALGSDDQLPWAMLGVPVAMVGFDPGMAWAANTAFTAGQFITDANGNVQVVQNAGTTGANQPDKWSTVYGDTTADNTVTWVNSGLGWKPLFADCNSVVRAGGLPRKRFLFPVQASANRTWQGATPYNLGDFIIDPAGNIERVVTAGTTAALPPNFATVFETVVADGGVKWENFGPATWRANVTFAAGQFIYDTNGNLQFVQRAGTSGATEPVWNGAYLPTVDGGVTWINNGPDEPAIVEDPLAQARIAQLSEQLSQSLTDPPTFGRFSDIMETMPPCGLVPAQSVDFSRHLASWFPLNWRITAAPVFLEELETALKTSMHCSPLAALGAEPDDPKQMEPVDLLVPLPDSVYDPNILITETVSPVFQQEVDKARALRNYTLRVMQWVQRTINANLYVILPNPDTNPDMLDLDAGLTADEIQGRNAMPPFVGGPDQNYGAILFPSTWAPNRDYPANSIVIDTNGATQVVITPGTSGTTNPAVWNTVVGQQTPDGVQWTNKGKPGWTPNHGFSSTEVIFDSSGSIQIVQTGGISSAVQPAWNQNPGTSTQDGSVVWICLGKSPWQPQFRYQANQAIIDPNGLLEFTSTGGLSGATIPTFASQLGGVTTDGQLSWLNNGSWIWEANRAYVQGQFVMDSNGFMQVAQNAGISASSPPPFRSAVGEGFADCLRWVNAGNAQWQANHEYSQGDAVFDSNGNIQVVQTGGISDNVPPKWNPARGQGTQDAAVVWANLGRQGWQAQTVYTVGEGIIDDQGNIQLVSGMFQTGGTSGTQPPSFDSAVGAITDDAFVMWINVGTLRWQPNHSDNAGVLAVDGNGNIQVTTSVGVTGTVEPTWQTHGGATQDGSVTWILVVYFPVLELKLVQSAFLPPYVVTYLDSQNKWNTVFLLGPDIFKFAGDQTGLSNAVASLNGRVAAANDLLDTGFLIAQTDIYRFREQVLGATAATTLATSPILANIASGLTASATAANLKDYISGLGLAKTVSVTPAVVTATGSLATPTGGVFASRAPTGTREIPSFNVRADQMLASLSTKDTGAAATAASDIRDRTLAGLAHKLGSLGVHVTAPANVPVADAAATARAHAVAGLMQRFSSGGVQSSSAQAASAALGGIFNRPVIGGPQNPILNVPVRNPILNNPVNPILERPTPGIGKLVGIDKMATGLGAVSGNLIEPGVNAPVSATDITNQSPIVGGQLNVRTLTIAERLALPSNQEAMFYSIANRISFLNGIQQNFTNNLGVVVDDLPIITDDPGFQPPATPNGTPVPIKVYAYSEWRDPNQQKAIQSAIQSPKFSLDPAEATLFSVGIRVLEQHTMLLRAMEARVQIYADFADACTSTLGSMVNNIQQAHTYLTQLQNQLTRNRQDVAYTTALLADETQRVNAVNAQRQQVLATQVHLVAYTRPRSVRATATSPSRQLEPTNVTSPVPACLQQSISVPPALREIVGHLREAPVNWMPAMATLLNDLERPILLNELALSIQIRAMQMLQMASLPSSSAGETGVYSSFIATVYNTNLTVMQAYVAQRASFQPALIANLSWSLQVATLQSLAAANDLIASNAVHAEISNATARLIQQIASVATCLYTRAGLALPILRLGWADYLSGPGASVSLQNLAVLPNWSDLSYIDRQQMQLLADWLFQQIDTSIPAAVAFMSDVARTAILLASDDPVDNIIPGNILVRTQPVIGGTVSLNLPSHRIASGMFVHLYSGATLAARAVVTDLDATTVTASITDVFEPETYLQPSDVAHFTTLAPQAIALRPLMLGN